MKDFTTSEYINPIINEIISKYAICHDEDINIYLNCDLVLESPYEIGTLYPVSFNKDFYISGLTTLDDLVTEISDFSICVETYPGELDIWMDNEINRVYNATRDLLIKKFCK